MTSTNGNVSAEPVVLVALVAAAERFARAIVLAFEVCEIAGRPLSQDQKVALVEAALVEFDGFEADVTSLARVGELLHDAR